MTQDNPKNLAASVHQQLLKRNTKLKVKGTLWAVYNDVTEFTDHRDFGFGDSRHLQNVWFGTGYSTKARAFQVAETKMRVGWN